MVTCSPTVQCCGSGMFFTDPDPTFQIVLDLDTTWIFSINLNINLPLYSRPLSLLNFIVRRDTVYRKLQWGFFFEKKECIFFILSNLLRKGHILSNFQRSFISNSFWIRSWPGPAKTFGSGPGSGSTTLATTCPCSTVHSYYPLQCRTRGIPRMWLVPRSLFWLALRCLSTPGQKIQPYPLRPVFWRPYRLEETYPTKVKCRIERL